MEFSLNFGQMVQIVSTLVAVGFFVWRASRKFATLDEQIKTLFVQTKDSKVRDEKQDQMIQRLEDKTTDVDKNVAIIKTRSAHLEETTGRIEGKLDRLIDAIAVQNSK